MLKLQLARIGILLCVVFGWAVCVSAEETNVPVWVDQPITASFQDQPLQNVLKEIAKQTGAAIYYDQELMAKKVTGDYKNVKFSEAINRLFSGTNKSIQVGRNEKKIIVKTFGAKHFVLAGSEKASQNSEDENVSEQITLGYLEKMHKQQYREYKERLADENEMLEGGITRGELEAMHKQQYEQLQASLKDENTVIPGMNGMTLKKLGALHKQQYEELQASLKDENTVIPGMNGMTLKKLGALHKQQHKELQAKLGDKLTLVPESPMTLKDLEILHKQQYEQLQAALKNKNTVVPNVNTTVQK